MKNGTCWLDDAGDLIQAHGGMITKFGDKWYWYGENKDGPTLREGGVGFRVDVIGFSRYSSLDLVNWHYEGLALAAKTTIPAIPCIHPKLRNGPKSSTVRRLGNM